MDNKIETYNLRVYGLLIHEKRVLVTDEHRGGMMMTKFPGGGLEKGEGLADCLIREFQEELSIQISVNHFFYVNDFFQVSAFSKTDQLLSFYYRVSSEAVLDIPISTFKRDLQDNEQIFRWVKLTDLDESMFNFPVDKCVCGLLIKMD